MFRKLVMQQHYLDTHLPLASPVFDATQDKAALHYLSLDRERLANNCRAVNFDALPQPLLVGGQALGKSMILVPHGGRCYPHGWFDDIHQARARTLEDTGTDILGLMLAARNRPALIAQIGRALCDLNRPEDAVDKQLCPEGTFKPAAVYKPYIAAGYGVIPRLSAAREPLYSAPFSPDEVAQIITRYHRPYHLMLKDRLQAMLEAKSHIVLIDLHSMPDPARQFNQKKAPALRRALPDFIFGNLHGATLPASLVEGINAVMGTQNYSWGWNAPYAGGYTTRHYGLSYKKADDKRVSVLQIEVNRTLFLSPKGKAGEEDKANGYLDSAALISIASTLDRLITELENAS